MADDYSSFERDYFRKSKRREDLKQQKSNSKQVRIYEPKSAQKNVKVQGYVDELGYPTRIEEDHYDNHTNHNRTDTYKEYVSKASSASKVKYEENNKFKAWKKETPKNKKNTGESQRDKPHKHVMEWVPSSKNTSFFEEKKPAMANNSNSKPLPQEIKHSSGEDSSMTSAGHSTNATTDDRKSMEVFDFSQDQFDPIQALKSKMRKESQNSNRSPKQEAFKEEGYKAAQNLERQESLLKEDNKGAYENDMPNNDNGKEIDDEGDNYSDIDARMEKKLLTNEVELNDDVDPFNQAEVETRLRTIQDLDDNKRPVWEDLDTNKVLDDIKKLDYLPTFTQDIKLTWQDGNLENALHKNELNIMQITQLDGEKKSSNHKSEEDDDYFDHMFSLKILDEPEAIIPDLFTGWGKCSSDKQTTDTSLIRNPSASQSFDLELISHKERSHTPLPAFRNCHVRKDNNTENLIKEVKNESLSFKSFDKQPSLNLNNSTNIFQSLIPNNEAKIWYYKDLEGKLQGPYSSRLMDDWYSKGYLPIDLDITIGNNSGFRKIRELAEIVEKNSTKTSFQGSYGQNNYTYPQQTNALQHFTQYTNKDTQIKKNVQSAISENSCPNVRDYTFVSNARLPNSFMMSAKPTTTNFSPHHSLQSYLNKPLFTPDFDNFKGASRSQMTPSTYKTPKMPYVDQVQGFDNRFEANSNQVRNLPR